MRQKEQFELKLAEVITQEKTLRLEFAALHIKIDDIKAEVEVRVS